MHRFRLTLEYDGSLFSGWQLQVAGSTVQGALENALHRLCGHPVRVIGAGRTDSGVHATGQVAHFDTTRPRSCETFVRALNAEIPAGLSVLAAEAVDPRFHARNSAIYREYLYRIRLQKTPPALDRHRVWYHPWPLDVVMMREAASCLLGKNDFSAFRAASCQAEGPVRTMSRLDLETRDNELWLIIGADAFLQHMVRNIVGSLVLVGRNRWSPEHFFAVFASKDRKLAGPTAPATGLYLTHVVYKTFSEDGDEKKRENRCCPPPYRETA